MVQGRNKELDPALEGKLCLVLKEFAILIGSEAGHPCGVNVVYTND